MKGPHFERDEIAAWYLLRSWHAGCLRDATQFWTELFFCMYCVRCGKHNSRTLKGTGSGGCICYSRKSTVQPRSHYRGHYQDSLSDNENCFMVSWLIKRVHKVVFSLHKAPPDKFSQSDKLLYFYFYLILPSSKLCFRIHFKKHIDFTKTQNFGRLPSTLSWDYAHKPLSVRNSNGQRDQHKRMWLEVAGHLKADQTGVFSGDGAGKAT